MFLQVSKIGSEASDDSLGTFLVSDGATNFSEFGWITHETEFYQRGWVSCVHQDVVVRVKFETAVSLIYGTKNVSVDLACKFSASRACIESFNSVNGAALPIGVKMNTYHNRFCVGIAEFCTLIQGKVSVIIARHFYQKTMCTKEVSTALCDSKVEILFTSPSVDRSGIPSSVPRVQYDYGSPLGSGGRTLGRCLAASA